MTGFFRRILPQYFGGGTSGIIESSKESLPSLSLLPISVLPSPLPTISTGRRCNSVLPSSVVEIVGDESVSVPIEGKQRGRYHSATPYSHLPLLVFGSGGCPTGGPIRGPIPIVSPLITASPNSNLENSPISCSLGGLVVDVSIGGSPDSNGEKSPVGCSVGGKTPVACSLGGSLVGVSIGSVVGLSNGGSIGGSVGHSVGGSATGVSTGGSSGSPRIRSNHGASIHGLVIGSIGDSIGGSLSETDDDTTVTGTIDGIEEGDRSTRSVSTLPTTRHFLQRSLPVPPPKTSGYSFNPLSSVAPRKRSSYQAPFGSESVFRSFDLESMKIPKRRKVSSCIIDDNYPLPSMDYTNMEPYRLSCREAPRRRAVFLMEHLHDTASSRVFSQTLPKRLMTPGTKSVVGLHRGRMGMYLTNQSRRHVHYEEDSRKLNSYIGLARQQNINPHIFPTRDEPYSFSNNGWNLFFVNGADWNGRVKGMHLSEVAHLILFRLVARCQRLASEATVASHSVGLGAKVLPKSTLIPPSQL